MAHAWLRFFITVFVLMMTPLLDGAVAAPPVMAIDTARAQMVMDACADAYAAGAQGEVCECTDKWMTYIDRHMPPTSFCLQHGALTRRIGGCRAAIARGLRTYRSYGALAMAFGLVDVKVHCNEFVLCGAPFPPQEIGG